MAKGKSDKREARRSAQEERQQERRKSVDADLTRLQGRSRSDLMSDQERQAGSPLGGGTHSRRRR